MERSYTCTSISVGTAERRIHDYFFFVECRCGWAGCKCDAPWRRSRTTSRIRPLTATNALKPTFQSLVISSNGGSYSAGGVRSTTQRLIDERGSLVSTSNRDGSWPFVAAACCRWPDASQLVVSAGNTQMQLDHNGLFPHGRRGAAGDGIRPRSCWDGRQIPMAQIPNRSRVIQADRVGAGSDQREPADR